MAALTPDEALALLGHRLSPKRRSAARRLGRLADPVAGPALLEALEREVRNPRTWETQYEIVMALGTCGHRPGLDVLRELARRPFDADAVYAALGYSIVRLSTTEDVADSLKSCLGSGSPLLATVRCAPLPSSALPWTRPRPITCSTSSHLLVPTTDSGTGPWSPQRNGQASESRSSSGSA
ncbi:HEAT repeat domain-containing protein [Streptomyces tsukubensis]|uniref:HEAT repeat domain-containing protein n=1 Tax=Streptomyces tsukubensis TaxID=83656 RepID=UPI00344F665D